MTRKGKVLKICGWCGRAFLSNDDRRIDYCCEECENKTKVKRRNIKDEF